MRAGWLLLFALAGAGCLESNSVQCSDRLCPPETACDEIHHGCVAPDQLKTCLALEDRATCTISDGTPGLCHDHVCLPADCGDGFQQAPELCDGDELGEKPNCTDHGFYDAMSVGCNSACNYDTSMCTGFCGDTMINGPELCDGAPPLGTCTDFGYGAGFLDCNQCGPGLADCKQFGWRTEFVGLEQLADVHGTSDKNIWVVGDHSTVMRLEPTGWNVLDLSACVTTPTAYDLMGIWVFSETDAIAIGNSPANADSISIQITATGCTVTTLASTSVTDIWAFGPNDVYATGKGIHHFDGTTWSSTNTTTQFFGLWGASATDLYATGVSGTTSTDTAPAMLHWNGTSWAPTATAAPVTGPLRAITGRAPNDLWIAGNDYDGLTRFLRYDGTTWTIENSIDDNTTALAASATHVIRWNPGSYVFAYRTPAEATGLGSPTNGALSKRALWVTPAGRIMAASGSGRILSFGGSDLAIYEPFLSPLLGLAAAPDGHAAIISSGSMSLWNGYTAFKDASIPPSNDAWIDPATFDLYILQSDGLRHRPFLGGSFPSTPDVAITSAGEVYGRATNDLWFVKGNGDVRHWNGTQLTCTTCNLFGVRYIAGAASDDMFAVGDAGKIWHWNGTAWSAQTSPTTKYLHAVSVSSATDAWAVGDAGTVLHYNGTSWTTVDVGTPFVLYAVWAFAPDDVFVGGVAGTIRHFDGTHWTPVKSPTQELIQDMIGVGDTLYLADEYSRLLRLVRTSSWVWTPM